MRPNFAPKKDDNSILANHQIRSFKIRVIKDGEQIGVMDKSKAIDYARGFDLDLIEIAKQDNMSICIVTDFGKYKYEQSIKEKQRRKSQVTLGEKELWFSPTTEKHDLDVQINKLKEFLTDGFNVKVTVRLKQNQRRISRDMWMEVIKIVIDSVADIASVVSEPTFSGRSLSAKVAPKKPESK